MLYQETNSTCPICLKRFNDSFKKIQMLNCGHLIHSFCINNINACKICLTEITNIYNENEVPEQKKIDIFSLKKTPWKPKIYNYFNLL